MKAEEGVAGLLWQLFPSSLGESSAEVELE